VEIRPVPQLGVLVSGRGSNLAAIAAAIDDGRLRAAVAVVVSNHAEAPALQFARERGIPARLVAREDYSTAAEFDDAVVEALRAHSVKLVCLAGFMRRLGVRFCDAFPNAILNIHPSLLPAFPGLDAQRQALDHGVKVAGATVHFVVPALDAGPIVAQESVPVVDGDTVESLSARILAVEHRLFPAAIGRVLAGGWHIDGRRVIFGGDSGSVG